MERPEGVFPKMRQLVDASTAIPTHVSKNAKWLRFTNIPKGTLVRVERVMYSEETWENAYTHQKEKANRMTAVVLLKHPESHLPIRAHYHMGDVRGACQTSTGMTTWTRFKNMPWSAKISGADFFSSECLEARHTRAQMKKVPLGVGVREGVYDITSKKEFDGVGCARQQFVDILLNSDSPTIQARIDGENKKLRVREENRDKLILELQKIKAFDNETLEAAPFDGYGYIPPLPQALENLCSVWVSSPIGSSALSLFTIKDILFYFTID